MHADCPRARNKRPLAVAARFVLSCAAGHLDDFPFRRFVHQGLPCPEVERPRLRMHDRSANLGANVEIRCMSCKARRNIREALGKPGSRTCPSAGDATRTCAPSTPPLARGSPRCWSSAPPISGSARRCRPWRCRGRRETELAAKVAEHWEQIEGFPRNVLAFARSAVPALLHFGAWTDDELWAGDGGTPGGAGRPGRPGRGRGGLRRPADARSGRSSPPPAIRTPTPDFALHRPGVARRGIGLRRRRRAGRAAARGPCARRFSRLDAPDPEDPDVVMIAPLSRSPHPEWVPASEVRGEGLFVRLPEPLLSRVGDRRRRHCRCCRRTATRTRATGATGTPTASPPPSTR